MAKNCKKHLSGAENRKKAKIKAIKTANVLSKVPKLNAYFNVKNAVNSTENTSSIDQKSIVKENSDDVLRKCSASAEQLEPMFLLMNKDRALWNINESTIDYFALNGFDQNIKSTGFSSSKKLYIINIRGKQQSYFRYFNPNLIKTKLANGESVNWLHILRTMSTIWWGPNTSNTFSKFGFCDWKKGDQKLNGHENSINHKTCVFKMKKRGSEVGRIDHQLILQVQTEKNYWKEVLTQVAAVVKSLSSRGLAMRGHEDKFRSTHSQWYLYSLLTELRKRINSYEKINTSFGFLFNITELSVLEVRQKAGDTFKRVKSYLRSSMNDNRLNSLAILNIESQLTTSLNYDDIIKDFKIYDIQYSKKLDRFLYCMILLAYHIISTGLINKKKKKSILTLTNYYLYISSFFFKTRELETTGIICLYNIISRLMYKWNIYYTLYRVKLRNFVTCTINTNKLQQKFNTSYYINDCPKIFPLKMNLNVGYRLFLDDALRSNLSSQIYYLYVYISKEAFIIYHNIHNSKDLNQHFSAKRNISQHKNPITLRTIIIKLLLLYFPLVNGPAHCVCNFVPKYNEVKFIIHQNTVGQLIIIFGFFLKSQVMRSYSTEYRNIRLFPYHAISTQFLDVQLHNNRKKIVQYYFIISNENI
ncbi:hypothetical protein QTP88_018224 [Uroleucon formosanum]